MIDTNADRLETPRQLAERVGLKEPQIRKLIAARQLEHIRIGGRVHITPGAWARFLEEHKVKPCRDETKGQDFAGSPNGEPTTSLGQSMAGAASAARARLIARKLKESSATGCSLEVGETGLVIPLKSS
jgi:excisionase family DNA binding protein